MEGIVVIEILYKGLSVINRLRRGKKGGRTSGCWGTKERKKEADSFADKKKRGRAFPRSERALVERDEKKRCDTRVEPSPEERNAPSQQGRGGNQSAYLGQGECPERRGGREGKNNSDEGKGKGLSQKGKKQFLKKEGTLTCK